MRLGRAASQHILQSLTYSSASTIGHPIEAIGDPCLFKRPLCHSNVYRITLSKEGLTRIRSRCGMH